MPIKAILTEPIILPQGMTGTACKATHGLLHTHTGKATRHTPYTGYGIQGHWHGTPNCFSYTAEKCAVHAMTGLA
ncbi:hypothetical protein ATR1_039c0068 [Acetobacter tropicalis]|uniref:Uncharacterized protein n=1 Tax=Acetobacter tropicalis TaxID=104102 RepID=A0A511FNH5_9PROT|nr:hypothetical protein ATR1_039c0068 [Acetobacter tropicalis]GEL50503.1 hypothetical protein ATR01nite_15780 [Acetobacter tropicalis]